MPHPSADSGLAAVGINIPSVPSPAPGGLPHPSVSSRLAPSGPMKRNDSGRRIVAMLSRKTTVPVWYPSFASNSSGVATRPSAIAPSDTASKDTNAVVAVSNRFMAFSSGDVPGSRRAVRHPGGGCAPLFYIDRNDSGRRSCDAHLCRIVHRVRGRSALY